MVIPYYLFPDIMLMFYLMFIFTLTLKDGFLTNTSEGLCVGFFSFFNQFLDVKQEEFSLGQSYRYSAA